MTEHVVESTFELSAFMKASAMADSERDSSSCLDADEDSRSDLHSPTASEDSVEVQVTPISLRNKRKLAEPRKIQEPAVIAAPLKKRRFDPISEETTVDQEESRSVSTASPFRPWVRVSCENESKTTVSSTTSMTTMTTMTSSTTTTTTTTTMTSVTSPTKTSSSSEKEEEERKKEQDETMQRLHESFRRQHPASYNKSFVSSRREPRQRLFESTAPITTTPSTLGISRHPRLQDEPLSLVVRNEKPRVPSHPAVSGTYEKTPSYMMEHLLATSSTRNHQNHQDHRNHENHQATSSRSSKHQNGQQRNYKNMTRERRIEANARERTRVHTISAAFDTLRRAIPAYSHNQKLSKLSVLRIACSYIMTLSKILQDKDGEVMTTRNNGPTDLDGCIELVSRTIQTEGKLRKRKDD